MASWSSALDAREAASNSSLSFFADNNIGSAVFYPQPLHLQECFSGLGYKQGDLPVTERICEEVLSLPIYPELSQEQIEYVAGTVLKFF